MVLYIHTKYQTEQISYSNHPTLVLFAHCASENPGDLNIYFFAFFALWTASPEFESPSRLTTGGSGDVAAPAAWRGLGRRAAAGPSSTPDATGRAAVAAAAASSFPKGSGKGGDEGGEEGKQGGEAGRQVALGFQNFLSNRVLPLRNWMFEVGVKTWSD